MPVKRDFSISVGLGAPMLVTVFLVLSLISFSVLSYVTSQTDYRFARELESRVINTVKANNQGELKLSHIKSVLRDVYNDTIYLGNAANDSNTGFDTEEVYFNLAREMLYDYQININNYLNFSVIINDNQNLEVTLRLLYPTNENEPFFLITKWQVVQTGPWIPDESIDLLEVSYEFGNYIRGHT